MARDPSLPIVCGVYFLFRNGSLEYVGQSKDCHARIATHRANGRDFDLATVMPLRSEFMTEVENALIKAYAPPKNVQQKPSPQRAIWTEPSRPKKERPPVEPDAFGTVSRGKAREMAISYGIGSAAIDAAVEDGRLRFFESLRSTKGKQKVLVALHSDVEDFCKAEHGKRLSLMGLPAAPRAG